MGQTAGDLSLSSMVLHPLGEQSLCALLCSAPIRLIRFSSLLSITQKRHRVLKKQHKKTTLKPSQFHSGQPAGQNKTPLPPCFLEMLFTLRLSLEADGIKAASDAQC